MYAKNIDKIDTNGKATIKPANIVLLADSQEAKAIIKPAIKIFATKNISLFKIKCAWDDSNVRPSPPDKPAGTVLSPSDRRPCFPPSR